MGYRELIQAQARNAFKAIGNLATDITLVQKDSVSFDFATGAASKGAVRTTNIKAIFSKKKRRSNDDNSIHASVILLAETADDLTVYDKVVINGETWNMELPYENDGFLITISLSRMQGAAV